MFYRLMRSLNDWYALAVLWTYVGAFILAFALVFVFPLGPLILLFLGLGGLAAVFVMAQALRWLKDWAARLSLKRGVCPMCLEGGQPSPDVDHPWRCMRCGAEFSGSGAEWVTSPSS